MSRWSSVGARRESSSIKPIRAVHIQNLRMEIIRNVLRTSIGKYAYEIIVTSSSYLDAQAVYTALWSSCFLRFSDVSEI